MLVLSGGEGYIDFRLGKTKLFKRTLKFNFRHEVYLLRYPCNCKTLMWQYFLNCISICGYWILVFSLNSYLIHMFSLCILCSVSYAT